MHNFHTGLLVFFITLKRLKWLFSQVTLEDTPAPYFDPNFVILILMKDSFKKGEGGCEAASQTRAGMRWYG